MNIKNALQIVSVSLLVGISSVWILENFFKKSNCYDVKQSTTILQSLKQEPVWRGVIVEDKEEKLSAIFGNSRTGRWTRVTVDISGNVCFLETGTDFQSVVKNTINL